VTSTWQKKLKYRGFRLLGFSLPFLMLSLLAASMIPRRPPVLLADGEIRSQKVSRGRFLLPVGMDGDIPITLALQWEQRPSVGRVELRISDPEGQDQQQKKIKINAQGSGTSWQQTLQLRLNGGSLRNFTLAAQTREPLITHYSFTAFAAQPWLRILRIGEMLLYPALAFVFLALVMVLFPSFISS